MIPIPQANAAGPITLYNLKENSSIIVCYVIVIIPKELEVRSLNHPYSLKIKSSQCHYVMRFEAI